MCDLIPFRENFGIGDPQRFFGQLRTMGLQFVAHAYPDHHAFSAADVSIDGADAILMTEKDAVKCAKFADAKFWALPVDARVADELGALVLRKLGKP